MVTDAHIDLTNDTPRVKVFCRITLLVFLFSTFTFRVSVPVSWSSVLFVTLACYCGIVFYVLVCCLTSVVSLCAVPSHCAGYGHCHSLLRSCVLFFVVM